MSNKVVKNKDLKEINKKNLEAQRLRDREIVKGIFRFHEVSGGSMKFVYRKYKGDPIEKFTMQDGEVYEVPRGVAVHLNENGWYPVYSYAMDEQNKPSMKIGKKVNRFSFQSLEFTNENLGENPSEIVTVENVINI